MESQVNVKCDLHVQQPINDTRWSYWRWYGVSLLSEYAAIPTVV